MHPWYAFDLLRMPLFSTGSPYFLQKPSLHQCLNACESFIRSLWSSSVKDKKMWKCQLRENQKTSIYFKCFTLAWRRKRKPYTRISWINKRVTTSLIWSCVFIFYSRTSSVTAYQLTHERVSFPTASWQFQLAVVRICWGSSKVVIIVVYRHVRFNQSAFHLNSNKWKLMFSRIPSLLQKVLVSSSVHAQPELGLPIASAPLMAFHFVFYESRQVYSGSIYDRIMFSECPFLVFHLWKKGKTYLTNLSPSNSW